MMIFKKLALLAMVVSFCGKTHAMTDDEVAGITQTLAQATLDGKSECATKEKKVPQTPYIPKHDAWYEMIRLSHRIPDNCLDYLLKILKDDFNITPKNEHTKDQKELDSVAQTIAQQFKERGIDVNKISDEVTSHTFLHIAALGMRNQVSLKRKECNIAVLVLCYAGADVNNPVVSRHVSEDYGATALLLATRQRYFATVKTLLRFNADPSICGNWKRNTLHIASAAGDSRIVRTICDRYQQQPEQLRALVNAPDKTDDTSLHLACANAALHANDKQRTEGFCEVITALFECGANGLSRNMEYQYPEHLLPVIKTARDGTSYCPEAKYGTLLWDIFNTRYLAQVRAAEAARKQQEAQEEAQFAAICL